MKQMERRFRDRAVQADPAPLFTGAAVHWLPRASPSSCPRSERMPMRARGNTALHHLQKPDEVGVEAAPRRALLASSWSSSPREAPTPVPVGGDSGGTSPETTLTSAEAPATPPLVAAAANLESTTPPKPSPPALRPSMLIRRPAGPKASIAAAQAARAAAKWRMPVAEATSISQEMKQTHFNLTDTPMDAITRAESMESTYRRVFTWSEHHESLNPKVTWDQGSRQSCPV